MTWTLVRKGPRKKSRPSSNADDVGVIPQVSSVPQSSVSSVSSVSPPLGFNFQQPSIANTRNRGTEVELPRLIAAIVSRGICFVRLWPMWTPKYRVPTVVPHRRLCTQFVGSLWTHHWSSLEREVWDWSERWKAQNTGECYDTYRKRLRGFREKSLVEGWKAC